MAFSWNSTHTALLVLGAIIIAGFQYAVDPIQLGVITAPIAAYIVLRERARVSEDSS